MHHGGAVCDHVASFRCFCFEVNRLAVPRARLFQVLSGPAETTKNAGKRSSCSLASPEHYLTLAMPLELPAAHVGG